MAKTTAPRMRQTPPVLRLRAAPTAGRTRGLPPLLRPSWFLPYVATALLTPSHVFSARISVQPAVTGPVPPIGGQDHRLISRLIGGLPARQVEPLSTQPDVVDTGPRLA